MGHTWWWAEVGRRCPLCHVPFSVGYRASRATPIQWYQHCEREAYSHRHRDSTLTLFNWFSDHSLAGSGRIAEVGHHWPCQHTASCVPLLLGYVIGSLSSPDPALFALPDHQQGPVAQPSEVLWEDDGFR